MSLCMNGLMLKQSIFCDYSEFYGDETLADCTIRVFKPASDEYEDFYRHSAILSNSSEFFYNIFTSQMIESTTRIIEIKENPKNAFPLALSFIYTGNINFTIDVFMPLMFIARNYAITQLYEQLVSILQSSLDNSFLLKLANQCFDLLLPIDLQYLEPFFASRITEFSMKELSEILDCKTFAHILKLSNISNAQKFDMIPQFLQDWNLSDEEKISLSECLTKDDSLTELIKNNECKFLPESYLCLFH